MTEFGAEANGRNATTSPGGYAFQSHLLDLHLSTYASIPDLSGALIWNLRDFAVAPTFFGGSIRKQVPNISLVRGLNQKGLFDVRYKAKPSVSVVNGRFAAQAAADGPRPPSREPPQPRPAASPKTTVSAARCASEAPSAGRSR